MGTTKLYNEMKSALLKFCESHKLDGSSPGCVFVFKTETGTSETLCVGNANCEKSIKLDEKTNFLLASLTKPIIHYYFLQQHADKLNTSASDYIKDIDPRITIKQLLEHKSGLQEYLDYLTADEVNTNDQLDDIVELICSKDLEFTPGEKNAYSNSGYVILSKVIGVIEGSYYAEVLENYYAAKGVNFSYKISQVSNRANGYELLGKEFKVVKPTRYITGWGDGYVYSTPTEFMKFLSLNEVEGALVSSEGPYGKIHWHNGGVPGASTLAVSLLDKSVQFLVFSNFTLIDPHVNTADMLLDLLLGSSGE